VKLSRQRSVVTWSPRSPCFARWLTLETLKRQYELGFLVLTECDLVSGPEGFAFFRAAADQGHPEAMYRLATFPEFLSEPFKSPLSEEETWSWLVRAAELGCAQAQYDAAASLATGDGGARDVAPQDLEAAVAWYRRVAEAGHAEAQFNLASMLMEGDGCERDLAAAKEWLRRSVAGGYAYAQELLAHLEALK
jgi:TPR repeat protein